MLHTYTATLAKNLHTSLKAHHHGIISKVKKLHSKLIFTIFMFAFLSFMIFFINKATFLLFEPEQHLDPPEEVQQAS